MNFSTVVVIVLLIKLILLLSDSYESFVNRESICNDIDGRCYDVSTRYHESTHEDASELLAEMNMFAIEFMRQLRQKYLFNKSGDTYKRKMVAYLLNNYNPDNIIENVPKDSTNTSYVEDKGKVFALCLRERETGDYNFESTHTLKFVLIHEMAHLASFNIGHGKEFWVNFKILLKEAHDFGLYKPINYKHNPVKYCSLLIDYNPYFDANIPSLIN